MGTLLLVTGPAGAGKSTVCDTFLKQAAGTWAYVNQDTVRQFVKAGYASADGEESSWSNATNVQWETSIPVCCDIARRYLQHGISCLVDFTASPDEFERWKLYLDGLDFKLVVLLPNESVDMTRNQARAAPAKLTDEKIAEVYNQLEAWRSTDVAIIDTSNSTVDQAVIELSRLAGQRLNF